jgi:5-methylcytosine-specific restriction endonuclease McrA
VNSALLLNASAATDATFRREGRSWVGKCLICNGPLRFDAASGEGATVEHIRPRTLGGGNELLNLGIAHRRCNGEKGIRWDGGTLRRLDPARYEALVAALLSRRLARWRDAHADMTEA